MSDDEIAEGRTVDGTDLSSVHEAALTELERRHRLAAEEFVRLSALLSASGRADELNPTTDLRGSGSSALASTFEAAPVLASAWERSPGGMLRSPGLQPGQQRVIHLGTERSPRIERRRTLAVGASAGAVGAVAAAAVLLLFGQGLGLGGTAQVAEAVAPIAVASPTAEAAAPQPAAAQAAPAPVAAPEPPSVIDGVLAQAATAVGMGEGTAGLVRRLEGVDALSGPARAEEAADIYGMAVTEARTDASGMADRIVTALEPEVNLDAVTLLAVNRPDVVGSGMGPLVDDLHALHGAPAGEQQAEAQQIMDAVAEGVMSETIAGPYCNSIALALQPYGAVPPG